MSLKLTLFTLWSFFVAVRCRPGLARIPAAAESSEAAQCEHLTAPWSEVTSPHGDWSHFYRLKVLPMPRNGPNTLVFPEPSLFRFVRRVYRCCQLGHHCGGVKGIQGRETGGSVIEFLLSEDVLSAPVLRAEVHLHISNPHHLEVWPLLPWLHKRHLPTRYTAWPQDGAVELRVDLIFLFQALHALGGKRPGLSVTGMRRVGAQSRSGASEAHAITFKERPLQVPTEFGLALQCSAPDLHTRPCESYGVRLLHTPFITLSYG